MTRPAGITTCSYAYIACSLCSNRRDVVPDHGLGYMGVPQDDRANLKRLCHLLTKLKTVLSVAHGPDVFEINKFKVFYNFYEINIIKVIRPTDHHVNFIHPFICLLSSRSSRSSRSGRNDRNSLLFTVQSSDQGARGGW